MHFQRLLLVVNLSSLWVHQLFFVLSSWDGHGPPPSAEAFGCLLRETLAGTTELWDLSVVVADEEARGEFLHLFFGSVAVAAFRGPFQRLLVLNFAEAAHQFLDMLGRAHGGL